jgi:RNA polymerase sigma-70 factor (ECF subfamily)
VKLAPAEFVAYLGRRLSTDLPPATALRKLYTSDLYLACACGLGDARAIAAFEAYCLSVVEQALLALHVEADMVAEVKQQLRHNLFVGDGRPPEILDFGGRGDLRGWVRVMAARMALARRRRARKTETLDEVELEMLAGSQEDLELELLKNRYRDEFRSALGEALRSLPARERTLLRQQFVDGLTIDELGALYRVHRATAARWLRHAREAVLARTKAVLIKRLALQPAELESILRVIRSGLDVSLRALFRPRSF